MIVFTYVSSSLVPVFTGIVSHFGFKTNKCIFVIQMTKNILILEGDLMPIKKRIYFFTREIFKKGLCPKYYIVKVTMETPGRLYQIYIYL